MQTGTAEALVITHSTAKLTKHSQENPQKKREFHNFNLLGRLEKKCTHAFKITSSSSSPHHLSEESESDDDKEMAE